MTRTLKKILAASLLALVMALPVATLADELTERIQKDLVALGYDPGSIGGEVTTESTLRRQHRMIIRRMRQRKTSPPPPKISA